MATLSAAPTRHHHTELFSEILLNQYLPGPEEGGMAGKKKNSSKMASKQQGSS